MEDDHSIIQYSDAESLYGSAISCVGAIRAQGVDRRIDIASIHALAAHEAHRSSELTRALRDAMLERVREGWTLRRIVSLTSQDGLRRERSSLDLIDAIDDARVQVRVIVVDAVPIFAPLIVGTQVAFLASEDDRDFAASEGIEFRTKETVEAVQRYFDLLWADPRAIRLRTSDARTSQREVSRAEAELLAFGDYQAHRDKSGLALDARVTAVELRLRGIISERLNNDASTVPPHVARKVDERLLAAARRYPGVARPRAATLEDKLEYSDVRELQDIITTKALWTRFEAVFGTKESLNLRFDQLAELRNALRHSRTENAVTTKDGEAALLWFTQVFDGLDRARLDGRGPG